MRKRAGWIAALAALAAAEAACGPDPEETPRPLPPPISLGPPSPGVGLPPGARQVPGDPPNRKAHAGPPAPPPVLVPAPAPSPSTPSDSPFPNPRPKGIAKERFAAPEGWRDEKPSTDRRLLQFRLPRSDGDPRDGEVLVFGTDMGPAKENIERWRGMFREVAQGKDALEEIPAGGGAVHLLDITGKYTATMPGAAPAEPADPVETRMLAAVVEIPAGRYYVKALGPPATVAKWEKSIRDFVLESAKK